MRHAIHGHAIVSADDRIAGPDGLTPPALRIDADWQRFQAALDRAAVTVLGRLGHEANPNLRRRNRLILSSAASGIEKRDDGWWWNPAGAGLAAALAAAAPAGGIVAVVGGRRVFDLFLAAGYDVFDLVRVRGVRVPGGVPLFSAIGPERGADAVLAAAGLVAGPEAWLDPAAGAGLTVWRRV